MSRGKALNKRLPGYHVRTELNPFQLLQHIHANREGGGFGDDSGWGNKDNIKIWHPLKVSHINPHPPPKRTCDGADASPKMEFIWRFGGGCEFNILFQPVAE